MLTTPGRKQWSAFRSRTMHSARAKHVTKLSQVGIGCCNHESCWNGGAEWRTAGTGRSLVARWILGLQGTLLFIAVFKHGNVGLACDIGCGTTTTTTTTTTGWQPTLVQVRVASLGGSARSLSPMCKVRWDTVSVHADINGHRTESMDRSPKSSHGFDCLACGQCRAEKCFSLHTSMNVA